MAMGSRVHQIFHVVMTASLALEVLRVGKAGPRAPEVSRLKMTTISHRKTFRATRALPVPETPRVLRTPIETGVHLDVVPSGSSRALTILPTSEIPRTGEGNLVPRTTRLVFPESFPASLNFLIFRVGQPLTVSRPPRNTRPHAAPRRRKASVIRSSSQGLSSTVSGVPKGSPEGPRSLPSPCKGRVPKGYLPLTDFPSTLELVPSDSLVQGVGEIVRRCNLVRLFSDWPRHSRVCAPIWNAFQQGPALFGPGQLTPPFPASIGAPGFPENPAYYYQLAGFGKKKKK